MCRLVLERRLLLLERRELRLEILLLARALRVRDLRLDLPLLGLVLRHLLQDRRQRFRRLGAVADDLLRLRARAGDLLVQRHLLGLELVRGGLELRLLLLVGLRLARELGAVRLPASPLLLELLLMRGQLLALRVQRVRLRLELLLLALALLLLLLKLLLQARCLLVLAWVLASSPPQGCGAY